jgi:ubiquinone/menaquinone biosynthesis C-methylase UbiE
MRNKSDNCLDNKGCSMGCHGGFALDDATRRGWYNPEQILQTIGLCQGMTFADVGCGDGFFTILAAKAVGEKGKVYAVDTDESAIEKLKNKAKEENLKNITANIGKAEETVLCKGCADFVFYSMVLHDFYNPEKVLQNAHEMLKPDGLLVDLDWKKTEMPFGPPVSIKFSQEYASSLIQTQGFTAVNVISVGLYHYVVAAKPKRGF